MRQKSGPHGTAAKHVKDIRLGIVLWHAIAIIVFAELARMTLTLKGKKSRPVIVHDAEEVLRLGMALSGKRS